MTSPIPNRACGPCNACCRVLEITELKKPPGVVCRNWAAGAGCTLHGSHPKTCRVWYCGWRMLPLGEEWRPDKSEILIFALDGPSRIEQGMQFELIGGLDKLFWMPFVNMIMSLIARNVPVRLSVTAEVGYTSSSVHLNENEALRRAVARRDLSAVGALLSQAAQASIDHPKTRIDFEAAAKLMEEAKGADGAVTGGE